MKHKTLFILFSFFFSANLLANSNTLSSTEQQITNYLLKTKNEQISLLKKLVNINSGTNNIEGVKKIGNILQPQFEALGFKTHWEQGITSMKRAPMLIAERVGDKGKRLLLIGHLDTVFPATSNFQHFTQIENKAFGPGVSDMKGGDVIILYALKALAESNALNNTTIRVVLTGDEEDSAKPTTISRKPMAELAKNSDIALDFESSQAQNTLAIARRGIVNWILKTQGKEGHSSQIFKKDLGDGAIFELSRILNEIRINLSNEKYFTFNPGVVVAGTTIHYDQNTVQGNAAGKLNIIAKTTIASGDLRYLTQAQKEKAEQKINKIIQNHLVGTNASIQYKEGPPSMPPTVNNLKLLEQYSQISQKLGYGEVKQLSPDLRGGGDISYVAPYISAGLVGMGAIGAGEHSSQEKMDLNSLVIQSQRAALLIYQLTRDK